jgi:uncharacterized protein (TIGR02246 family)
MPRIILAALLGLVALRPAMGQAPTAAEEKAVRTAVDSYTAAFNKGDLDGLVAHVATDADFTDEDGKQYRGKASLAELLKRSLADLKGQTLKTNITSLRFLRPDVAIVDGTADLIARDGTTDSGRFTAIWTKTGGKWLLSSIRDLPDSGAADTTPQPLKELEWLVGDWANEDPEFTVRVSGHWMLDKSFLLLEYSVQGKNKDDLTVIQCFGWDPVRSVIRSWFFDSQGGFGGGDWERRGNTWTAYWDGMLADGRTGSSLNSIKVIDDKSFLFGSVEREVEGLPMADLHVKFIRKTAGK